MTGRRLTLRREALTELSRSELGGVAGGEITVTCWCILHIVLREAVEAAETLLPTGHCGSEACA